MTVELSTPDVSVLAGVLDALRDWQYDGAAWQLHPGDLGWFWRFGANATAAAIRVWHRSGRIAAVGLLDGPGLIRLTIAPELLRDAELARRLVDDLSDPSRGIANGDQFNVESPEGSLLKARLAEDGWVRAEAWTPLRRDLFEPVNVTPVDDSGALICEVDNRRAEDWIAVERAAFGSSRFGGAQWQAMTTGPAYADARCLLAYDAPGNAAAAIAVWPAGTGRPGLIEPMGVHPDHRGRGYGTAIVVAGAVALQRLGASYALVYTPSANVAGVATYQAAGFTRGAEIHDQQSPSAYVAL